MINKKHIIILAATLIMLWLLFALVSRCTRGEADTEGFDAVVCDTMPVVSSTPDTNKWAAVPEFMPVKPVEPNKPPNFGR